MENLFMENRMVYMTPPETAGGAEKLKSAAEMPGQRELSYDFSKKLIKIEKSGDETTANPNRLIQYINSSSRTKLRTAAKWVQGYAKTEGYKLSKSDVVKKAKSIADFYNPRKNRNLRKDIRKFMQRAVNEGETSASEMKEMKKLVGQFSDRATKAMKQVIDSRSVQSVDARAARETGSNRATVIKQYLPKFKRIMTGTGIKISATAKSVKADVPDVEATAKRIKQKSRRDKLVNSILRYRKA